MVERDPRIESIKAELKPLIKRANQRLLRLEQAGLASSHGYRAVQDVSGRAEKPRFGVKDKTIDELYRERQKIQNFLDYKSSTVVGSKNLLKTYAERMRIPYSGDASSLVEASRQFFRLSSYVQQYIRNTSQARYISSDEVFMGISRAIESGEIDLRGINFDDFNLSESQMLNIVEMAGGQNSRQGSLFEDLESMDHVSYGEELFFGDYDPNDF